MAKGYRILSIEGGGIRGIIPARILKEIEDRSGKSISELFDIMVGTSTGALIAMALSMSFEKASNIKVDLNESSLSHSLKNINKMRSGTNSVRISKYCANDILNIYLTRGNQIFKKSLWHSIKTGYGLWGPKYDVSSYEEVLNYIFRDYRFDESLNDLFVLSFDGNPIVFSRLNKYKSDYLTKHMSMKYIALLATAAPTYFPPYADYIDGGIWANNPEMIPFEYIDDEEVKKNSYIVSIGTGSDLSAIRFPSPSNSGAIPWLKAGLIDIMMNSQNYYSSKHLEKLYNICKLQPIINVSQSAMDDVSKEHIQYLLSTAETYIKENSDKIDEMIEGLTKT